MENVETILNAAKLAARMAARDRDEGTEELLQLLLAKRFRSVHNNNARARSGSNFTGYSCNRPSLGETFLYGIIPFFGTVFRLSLWFGFLLLTSLCLYALVYFAYIPSTFLQRSVYLDYMQAADSELYIAPSPAHLIQNITTAASAEVGITGNMHSTGSQLGDACREDLFPFDRIKEGLCEMRSDEEKAPQLEHANQLAEDNHRGGALKTDVQNSALSPWPTAWLDLHTRHNQWESFADDIITPLHYSGSRLLNTHSSFYFEVHLLLLESYTNVNLGMFMLQLELFDDLKKILARSKRPVHFPHSSTFVRYIRKLCNVVPLVLGLFPEAKTVIVLGIDHYVDSVSRPLRYARIVLMLPPSATTCDGLTNNRQVQVLQAKLVIGRELTNLQRVMKQWFYASMMLGVAFLMVVQAFFYSIFGLFRWTVRRDHTRRESYSNADYVDGDSFSLRTLDIDSLSKDDVWEVGDDDEEKSHGDEFWDSLSFINEGISRRVKIVVSSDSEETSPEIKGKEKSHPVKEIKTSIPQVQVDCKCKLSKSDASSSSDRADGSKSDGIEAPAASERSRQKRKQLRRYRKSGRSAKIKSTQRTSPQHEDERVQRILNGLVEPYEIFTDLDDPDLQANIYGVE